MCSPRKGSGPLPLLGVLRLKAHAEGRPRGDLATSVAIWRLRTVARAVCRDVGMVSRGGGTLAADLGEESYPNPNPDPTPEPTPDPNPALGEETDPEPNPNPNPNHTSGKSLTLTLSLTPTLTLTSGKSMVIWLDAYASSCRGNVGRCGEMWGDVGRCGEMLDAYAPALS